MPLAKTDIGGIYRDISTNAIINTNDVDYNKIIAERKRAKDIQILHSELYELKRAFNELKEKLHIIESKKCNE